jgi:hypothetical protein
MDQLMRRATLMLAAAALLFGQAQAKADLVLNTPPGLSPGDTFRFVFVTDGSTNASSPIISDYDNFVTNQADGATYNGSTVTWQVIGSTDLVNAITHIGTNLGLSGVYLTDGIRVATGDGSAAGQLWSGSIAIPINFDIRGSPQLAVAAWTGTTADGSGEPFHTLGGLSSFDIIGLSTAADSSWIDAGVEVFETSNRLYGVSQVLTVRGMSSVPEPASVLLAVIGGSIGLVLGRFRKRQEQRHQVSSGPSAEVRS